MTDPELRFSTRAGTRLAYRHRTGAGPTIVFLPGYMSDMLGGKATALDTWAAETGRAMLRLDYAGCGESDGEFRDQTLDSWRDDVVHLVEELIDGPVLLVGSSMGGWLMLLAALALKDRVAGIVGIAAAPDFTGWGFTDEKRAVLAAGETLEEPSDYSDEPYVTTSAFWLSGERSRLLGRPIALTCPVRLLHGQADPDVPWDISLDLADALEADDVRITLIKDGDHRLSREEDIALLVRTVSDLLPNG
ncbi:alpha/beta hydrolase [Pacificimonas flava]|uniref:Palmitoyl-protein thioesterase ABHD10, mitochondrial n=2 Tax=Pacificimonas TaxID=1960290 RepID=A0A219B3S9_9SPHN|nr:MULTISPECIES: alpha/beta hydrolase [Pacificimonas]MBZ6377520.1 alpha/beta hydrolase [Pacificimonas aurantium]OWV32786.1 alpha/beta hydrolase [Pacificimonas flava]